MEADSSLRSLSVFGSGRTQWRRWLSVGVSLVILWHIESTPSAKSVQRKALQSAETVRISVMEALQGDGAAAPAVRLGNPFEPAVPCPARQRTGSTVFDILGRDVHSLVLARYDRHTWRDAKSAGDYINRIFGAVPEGGAPQTSVYWAESPAVLISGSLAFVQGPRRRVLIGSGYVHFEDESGCQWWARYLGPDKSKWVVPD
jgi:hypothetical protein